MEFRVGRSEALSNAGSMVEPNQGPFGGGCGEMELALDCLLLCTY